ncbi:unnamed protein product [Phaedon cochleariae]|uniref:Uncharacterized protein n=1 Tax=Phaedon cochleariae TaxID=80249 RepID=A0A9N9SMX6_PHACE|nr:unnamed protein product [Phaedon cochleariae]
MESGEKIPNKTVEHRANIISQLFFCWVLPFLKFDKDTQLKDIKDDNVAQDVSSTLTDQLEKNWREENTRARIKNTSPKLRKAILRTFGKSYAFFGLLMFLQCILLKTMLPIVVAEYLKYFDGADVTDNTGWCLGAVIVALALADVFVHHHCQVGFSRIGMRARTACSSMVYRKILRLSQSSLDKIDSNRLVSLLSNDVMKIDIAAPLEPHLYIMPIQYLGATFVLYDCVGLAGFAGLLVMLFQSVPLQYCLSKIQSVFMKRITLIAEKRIGLTKEIINGIQMIKLNAWEQPFEKMVGATRKLELDQISKLTHIKAITDSFSTLSEYAAILATLATLVLLGEQLESNVVFTAILVFSMLQYTCYCFQEALVTNEQSKLVMDELEEFLAPEEKGDEVRVISYTKNRKVGSLRATDARARWGSTTILKDINMKLSSGKLCCIVGHPGSGKTSLLLMLLKEMPLMSGKVDLVGTVSYASQQPWIFAASVRDNILFGRPYNRSKYRTITKACGLDIDFSQFLEGDKTILLDKGPSLNEAQKARISLARAVYADANVYLLDDCFSKMDPQLAKSIGSECILKYLGNKTRIWVTNQLEFVRDANLVAVLEDGRIAKAMKYQEWTESDLNELKSKFSLVDHDGKGPQHNVERRRSSISSTYSFLDRDDFISVQEEVVDYNFRSVLTDYLRAGANTCPLVCLAILFVISEVVLTLNYLWITYWVDANSTRYDSESNRPLMYTAFIPNILYVGQQQNVSQKARGRHHKHSYTLFGIQENYFFIYVQAAIVLTSFLLLISRSFVFRTICLVATKILHGSMFSNVLMGSMNFFLKNAPEKILHTFSEDLRTIEFEMPQATINIIHLRLVQVGMVLMVFLASPLTIVPAFLVAIVAVFLVKYYSSAVQTIKKLERTSRDPMISHIHSSVRGVAIIRSSEAEKMVTEEYGAMQDRQNYFRMMILMISEAFGFYLDVSFVFFLAAVIFHFNALKNEHTLSGCVGLAISQSIALIGLLQLEIRKSIKLSFKLASAERIFKYTMLPKEIPDEQVRFTPTNWPHFGKVIFRNAFLRYSPDEPPILNNLNMVALPGEKVGIIGKPGSSKSSVIAALFRLAPIEGHITIDDVDTSVTSLNTLRSSISLIPPDPLLFSPSVKFNLDPFDRLADDVLWKALEEVELTGVIGTLSQPVNERGSNFNLSTRQQICLAQVILRKNKIVILDVSTEHIDPHIDQLTNKTLTEILKNSTVLVITHRPDLVMDCDKVLVMETGRATECGHPHVLLQQPEGVLAKMARECGEDGEKRMRQMAKEDYDRKHFGIEFTFDRFE